MLLKNINNNIYYSVLIFPGYPNKCNKRRKKLQILARFRSKFSQKKTLTQINQIDPVDRFAEDERRSYSEWNSLEKFKHLM